MLPVLLLLCVTPLAAADKAAWIKELFQEVEAAIDYSPYPLVPCEQYMKREQEAVINSSRVARDMNGCEMTVCRYTNVSGCIDVCAAYSRNMDYKLAYHNMTVDTTEEECVSTCIDLVCVDPVCEKTCPALCGIRYSFPDREPYEKQFMAFLGEVVRQLHVAAAKIREQDRAQRASAMPPSAQP